VYEDEIKKLTEKLATGNCEEGKVKAAIADFEGKISSEKAKHQKWMEENVRRKHNFIPFIFHLLKELARKGKLDDVVEAAQKKAEERMEAQAKAKQK